MLKYMFLWSHLKDICLQRRYVPPFVDLQRRYAPPSIGLLLHPKDMICSEDMLLYPLGESDNEQYMGYCLGGRNYVQGVIKLGAIDCRGETSQVLRVTLVSGGKRRGAAWGAWERRRRDLGDICFIKDEEGRTITDEAEIKKIYEEYFSSLFNAREPEGDEEGVGPNKDPHTECYYSRISQTEVRTALQKMGRNKAVGSDQIPIEAWKSLGDEGTFWLTSPFNKIFTSVKMPKEWILSEVIPIFKNKVDAIHLIRCLTEKYKERQRDLHMAFLDLEKAYDSVPRELIWKTLVDKETLRRYIRVIRDMYDGAKTRVRTFIRSIEFFPLDVGLHQGSAINPYLFALILDELSKRI
nr:hypothetical protein [Tanacetum cinerariifolium]